MRLSKKSLGILILAGGLAFVVLFVFRIGGEMADFEVNYKAGRRLWLGETLYRAADEHYQFKYSPFSALLYLPLSFLPLQAAKAIWYVLTLVCLGLSLHFSSKLVASDAQKRGVLMALSGAILAKFLIRELELGQINALITALLLWMAWILSREEDGLSISRQIFAGLLWGIAAALKPYALIFLPYFLLKKRWTVLGIGGLFTACSLFLPTAFYGFPGNLVVLEEWASSLSRSTPSLLNSQDNVSLLAFLAKWTGNPGLSTRIYAVVLVCLALLVLVFVRKGNKLASPFIIEAALLLALIPIISPLGWDYTFFIAVLTVALVVHDFRFFPRPARIVLGLNFLVIALSIYDLLGRRLYASFMTASVLTVNFLILVAALFRLRFAGQR